MDMAMFTYTSFMLGLLLAIYAAARVMRSRLGLGAGKVSMGSMQIVGKRQLERGKSLYVVDLGNRYVLVGSAEQSLTLIDHITAEEFAQMSEPAVEAPDLKNSFASMLDLARSASQAPQALASRNAEAKARRLARKQDRKAS